MPALAYHVPQYLDSGGCGWLQQQRPGKRLLFQFPFGKLASKVIRMWSYQTGYSPDSERFTGETNDPSLTGKQPNTKSNYENRISFQTAKAFHAALAGTLKKYQPILGFSAVPHVECCREKRILLNYRAKSYDPSGGPKEWKGNGKEEMRPTNGGTHERCLERAPRDQALTCCSRPWLVLTSSYPPSGIFKKSARGRAARPNPRPTDQPMLRRGTQKPPQGKLLARLLFFPLPWLRVSSWFTARLEWKLFEREPLG